jgi:hypothetical protein
MKLRKWRTPLPVSYVKATGSGVRMVLKRVPIYSACFCRSKWSPLIIQES